MDRNFPFFLNRIELDSVFWWKHTNLRPIEKPRITYCQCFFPIGITQHLTQHPADNHRGVQMRATACMVACAPPQASVLFWRRTLGSYHSQSRVGGGSPKTPRTKQRWRFSYHRSHELSSVSSVASLGSRGTWPIELVAKFGLRPP